MTEQWQELKETIIELRDNDGTGTQQEACKFLANLMDVLEKQMQEPKTGHWIKIYLTDTGDIDGQCSECGFIHKFIDGHTAQYNYCPNCGCRMSEVSE